jgi:hypothetical protein
MTATINWFYVWGVIVIIVILGIVGYTYKEITGAQRQQHRRRPIDKNSVLAVLRAQADGSLYGLLEAEYSDEETHRAEDASDEVAAATRTLMTWTAVLAAATVLMAYFAYFTLAAILGKCQLYLLIWSLWLMYLLISKTCSKKRVNLEKRRDITPICLAQ